MDGEFKRPNNKKETWTEGEVSDTQKNKVLHVIIKCVNMTNVHIITRENGRRVVEHATIW